MKFIKKIDLDVFLGYFFLTIITFLIVVMIILEIPIIFGCKVS